MPCTRRWPRCLPLWQKGELGFAHAVSTPYRDKRSHFDGQDILEAGTGLDVPEPSVRDGWLNRMLQGVPGLTSETAFAVGRDEMKVLMGRANYSSWAPDAKLGLSSQSRNLLEAMYHNDPLFRDAATEAMDLSDQLAAEGDQDMGGEAMGGMMAQPATAQPAAKAAGPMKPDPLAQFAASRLKQDTRIATFSIGGWDTHRGQKGVLARQLATLSNTILTLRDDLGPVWARTTVIAMTEFGRTARENGSGGTDHGTGGVMVMAGGAVKGGQIYGRWPGLSDAALYAQRDLMPTADVRAYAAWAMRGMYGLDSGVLEKTVFPGLDMGQDPRILLYACGLRPAACAVQPPFWAAMPGCVVASGASPALLSAPVAVSTITTINVARLTPSSVQSKRTAASEDRRNVPSLAVIVFLRCSVREA